MNKPSRSRVRLLFTGVISALNLLPLSDGVAQEPKVKIGKETTYIEGPLTKDGYIDYVSHLNSVLSKGVTPENNAAVLLLKASPGEINNEKFLKRYCKALGIKPLSLKGDYFQNYYRFAISEAEASKGRPLTPQERLETQEAIEKDFEKAGSGPWKKTEIPSMARWMDANEKPLKLVRQATLRSRYYHPMLNSGEDGEKFPMIAILLPQAQATRSYARALMVRSMMYLGEGDVGQCTEDLLTMRRLGNHVASGATVVEQLVGIAIVGIAQGQERKMAFSGKLSLEQLVDYRSRMEKHRMKSNMVRSFSECERFMYLDSVQQVMKHGMTALSEITGSGGGNSGSQTRMQELMDKVVSSSTDWSITMKEGNRLYNKYENQLKTDDWVEQDEALAKMEKEIQQMTSEIRGTSAVVKAMLGGPEYRGKMMGKIFVGMLLPALNAASTAEKRAKVMDDLSYIILSASAHRAEKGEYPESIDRFSRSVVKKLPIDRYARDDYRYRRQENGFIVYSIGPNRKDDDGNGAYNERMDIGDDYGAGYDSVKGKPAAGKDLN